jgi:hypothetical protein
MRSAHRLSPALAWLAALLLVAAASVGKRAQADTPAPTDAPPVAETPQATRWIERKIYFTYLGFTTHYSCEGLADQVRHVLLELGARKSDLNVHEAGCTARAGEPTPFPAVAGTFSVLVPVAPAEAYSPSSSGGIVFAHWQPVNVRFDHSALEMSGQCELLEQVKQHILPLFPARNVQFKSLCVPHELFAGGTSLRVEVLIPNGGKT